MGKEGVDKLCERGRVMHVFKLFLLGIRIL